MQLGGDRQRTRRAQGRTTLHSVSHARTLWISTEHERVALPNVANCRSLWCQLPGLTNRSRSPPRHFPPLFSCRFELMPSTNHRLSATPSGALPLPLHAGAPNRVSSPVEPSSKSLPVVASPHAGPSYSSGRLPKLELSPSHHRHSWRLAAVECLHCSKPTTTPRRAGATRAVFSSELLPQSTYQPLCAQPPCRGQCRARRCCAAPSGQAMSDTATSPLSIALLY
jgi:hypothetical protein